MNNLTNKNYWAKNWQDFNPYKVPKKTFFTKYIPKEIEGKKSFIEIGGFPGTFSVYFHQQFGLDITILDFYIDKPTISLVEKVNHIPTGTIKYIEADFFNFKPEQKYDVVASFGFIEHFQDTKDVINRHIELLSDNGVLFITIPNFRGLNGFINKIFNPKSYNAHNLNSMRIDFLREIMKETKLQNAKVQYVSRPTIWLDNTNKIEKFLIRCGRYFIKLFPIPSQFLSAYIVISGSKN
jgi:2-polyprenyl-3-methyl-5-hydroxy-6-metoxy-1,4-benzoquinol methylase